MPVKYTVTLTSVGTSGVVTIPKPVIEGFGWHKGQKLELIVTDDKIVIEIPRDNSKPAKVSGAATQVD